MAIARRKREVHFFMVTVLLWFFFSRDRFRRDIVIVNWTPSPKKFANRGKV